MSLSRDNDALAHLTTGYEPKLLEIADDSDPLLLKLSEPVAVEEIACAEIQHLIQDMIKTMYAAPGIGLAAPQVRILRRIIVFYLPSARDDVNKTGVPLTVLINPNVEFLDDNKVSDYEACLSVPGKRGLVSRANKIRYRGLNERGEPIDVIAEGWHARLVQHEFDHLNGILYPSLMAQEDKLLTVDEWKARTGK